MKNLFTILLVSLAFLSCDDKVDPTIYDGNTSGSTFLSFSNTSYSLPVTIDATGSVDVILNSSNVSSVARTYAINIVQEETTADPLTYTIPSTVTIPAGSYQGVITVQGEDNGLVETTGKNLVITFTPLNDAEDFDTTKTVISIFQVCPINEGTFLGNYLMEQLTPINPDDGVNVFENQVVNIIQGTGGPTSRSFQAVYLEGLGIGQPISTIPFNLACLEVITGNNIATGLSCGGTPAITLGVGATPGAYDTEDDSEFTLTLTEYVTDGGCGAAPYQVTFRFTKQ